MLAHWSIAAPSLQVQHLLNQAALCEIAAAAAAAAATAAAVVGNGWEQKTAATAADYVENSADQSVELVAGLSTSACQKGSKIAVALANLDWLQ